MKGKKVKILSQKSKAAPPSCVVDVLRSDVVGGTCGKDMYVVSLSEHCSSMFRALSFPEACSPGWVTARPAQLD